MENPCKYCADYPHWCRGMCAKKMQYLNEVEKDSEEVREMEFNKNPRKLKIDYNKNGIRRETR